jgi:2,3,4,5-tetrahydropyridine-2,6-dicarboxylate N-succinyltransferase
VKDLARVESASRSNVFLQSRVLTNHPSAINNHPFMSSLKSSIERLAAQGEVEHDPEARKTFLEFRDQLTQGKIRAAEKIGVGKVARWTVNPWVKQGILLGFRLGVLQEMPAGLSFVDKDTFPARQFSITDKVRVVPGGSSVREGAYVAPSVICMPPMFINVGAYVDEGTMIDSHALVGSCAQIGKRVHLSAAAQVGGVLEPINAAPVIIEDDVLVGGNCGIYEGTLVRARAVLGAGTILTRSTPLYDLVRGEVYRATADSPLEVPENAVVVPGSRAVKKGPAQGQTKDWNLSLYTPVIVKYRDEKTDRGIELEEWIR